MDWSHGYNISEGYTYGFYREVAPIWIDLSLSIKGVRPPPRSDAGRFRYLELGCGQGFGLCLLAAANPEGEFVGVDFSPEHVAHAQRLASLLKLKNVTFLEHDFEQLGESWPKELGSFEYVVLHGIYSWISASLRRSIVKCLAACVSPGGAVYLSYNAMPGWTSTIPFQHILRLLEKRGGAVGSRAIEAGRTLFRDFDAIDSALTKALPALKARISSTERQSSAYLVQEYLHDNWHPLWSSQVHEELAHGKLMRAGTATLPENLLPGILPDKHRQILDAYTDPVVREDLVDALINQTFRRDLFTRGHLSRFPVDNAWRRSFGFWRANDAAIPDEITVNTAFGAIKLQANKYAYIFGTIGEGSATIDDLAAAAPAGVGLGPVLQVLLLLIHDGWLTFGPASSSHSGSLAEINQRLASEVAKGAPYRYLAASRAGIAVHVSDIEMLLLDAYHANSEDFATNAVGALKARLAALGKHIVTDGQALSETEEDKRLRQSVDTFVNSTLPVWRRLGVTG